MRSRNCCNRVCGARYWNLLRWRGEQEPRPLILEALWQLAEKDKPTRQLVKSGPGLGTRLPHTPERLLKLGAAIGAREPEVEAVIERQQEEAEALLTSRVS